MSGPFRSEVESIRAELERATEKMQHVLDEKADLERLIELRRKPSGILLAVGLLGLVTSTGIGFVMGSIQASARGDKALARREVEMADNMDRERIKLGECTKTRDDLSARTQACESKVIYLEMLQRSSWGTDDKCRCQPGDPLCACAGFGVDTKKKPGQRIDP